MKRARTIAAVVVAIGAGLAATHPPRHPAELGGSECAMPDCRTLLGWGPQDESSQAPEVDCRFGGPYAAPGGGAIWRGCNVGDARYAVGSACVPTLCEVNAGESLEQAVKRDRRK